MTRSKNVDSVELEERLTETLRDYKAGCFKSYRAAARAWNVPKTTLSKRAKGRKLRNQAHEDKQILTAAEEKKIKQWITRLDICDYPPKPHTIKEMAEAIRTRRTLGINDASITLVHHDEIGQKSVTRFLERHSGLAPIMPEQIHAARVKEYSHEVFQKWFTDVKSIIDEDDI